MRYDDPNVPLSAIIGLISAVLVFVIIVGLQAVFFRMQQAEYERKVFDRPYEALAGLDADQLEQLNSYGWISEAEGVAHIPIDRAIELTIRELAP